MQKALITGIAGQDGSYLAELLVKKGYTVSGVLLGNENTDNLLSIAHKIELIKGDVLDEKLLQDLVSKQFDEIYNLASVSTVQSPWEDPVRTVTSCGLVPLVFLEAIRTLSPKTRFFQASSAEMYGDPVESPQTETTPFKPQKPYAYGKLLAHQAIEGYRTDQRIFAVSGILFNHESPRRHEHFVTRKITTSLAKIKLGLQDSLALGNLDAKRDWGFAGDYVRAMQLMLEQQIPEDYVVATGHLHTVREFVETAAKALNIDIIWKGSGVEEIGMVDERVIIRVSKEFYRPNEMRELRGDNTNIKKKLGWEPRVSFSTLVSMMAKTDLEQLNKKIAG